MCRTWFCWARQRRSNSLYGPVSGNEIKQAETDGPKPAVPGLSADQIQKLLSLIETPKSGSEKLSGNGVWLLDSGASYHMTGDLKKLSKVRDIQPVLVGMSNGDNSIATKSGLVQLNSKIVLYDVLFVPGLNCNLISIAQLINELFCTVTFTHKLCVIQDHSMRTPIGVGEQRRGVYYFKEIQPGEVEVNRVATCNLWHRRLGHPSKQVMSLISSGNGFYDKKFSDESCDVCFRAKQTRLSFPISDNKAINCFDLIHCDIWGAYRVESLCGAHCFLSIVDDASRWTWVYLMKDKSEASQLVVNFCLMVKTQFDANVKAIRSDNESEFASCPMKKFYGEQGIIHQTSCVDTPQQNGGVERKHRHILNVARALRFETNLPLEF